MNFTKPIITCGTILITLLNGTNMTNLTTINNISNTCTVMASENEDFAVLNDKYYTYLTSINENSKASEKVIFETTKAHTVLYLRTSVPRTKNIQIKVYDYSNNKLVLEKKGFTFSKDSDAIFVSALKEGKYYIEITSTSELLNNSVSIFGASITKAGEYESIEKPVDALISKNAKSVSLTDKNYTHLTNLNNNKKGTAAFSSKFAHTVILLRAGSTSNITLRIFNTKTSAKVFEKSGFSFGKDDAIFVSGLGIGNYSLEITSTKNSTVNVYGASIEKAGGYVNIPLP